jgi:hypothetical protein
VPVMYDGPRGERRVEDCGWGPAVVWHWFVLLLG